MKVLLCLQLTFGHVILPALAFLRPRGVERDSDAFGVLHEALLRVRTSLVHAFGQVTQAAGDRYAVEISGWAVAPFQGAVAGAKHRLTALRVAFTRGANDELRCVRLWCRASRAAREGKQRMRIERCDWHVWPMAGDEHSR